MEEGTRGRTNEVDRGRRARTAEADAAGAAVVVDAEEVPVVRRAASAQEIDDVDPPGHLAGASSSCCPLLVRRVHMPFYLLLVSPSRWRQREGQSKRNKKPPPAASPDLFKSLARPSVVLSVLCCGCYVQGGKGRGRPARTQKGSRRAPRVSQNVGVGLDEIHGGTRITVHDTSYDYEPNEDYKTNDDDGRLLYMLCLDGCNHWCGGL
jgi:hypothetical protein